MSAPEYRGRGGWFTLGGGHNWEPGTGFVGVEPVEVCTACRWERYGSSGGVYTYRHPDVPRFLVHVEPPHNDVLPGDSGDFWAAVARARK